MEGRGGIKSRRRNNMREKDGPTRSWTNREKRRRIKQAKCIYQGEAEEEKKGKERRNE